MGTCSCLIKNGSEISEPQEILKEGKKMNVTEQLISEKFKRTDLKTLPLPDNIIQKLKELEPIIPETQKNNKTKNKIYLIDEDYLEGIIENDKLDGWFKYYITSKENYFEGFFNNGKPNGKGRLITKKLEIYEGEFENDFYNLHGSFMDNDGLTLTGNFIELQLHGRATEIWTNYGTHYEGNYVNGVKTGSGKLVWENENKTKEESYEGDFQNNLFEGKGVYLWGTQKKYVGEWKNGVMDGEGVFTWKDGREYKGKFKKDKKEGYGVLTWQDGRIWKGNWKLDKQDGIGEMVDSDGIVKQGLWEDGKRIKWLTKEETNNINRT